MKVEIHLKKIVEMAHFIYSDKFQYLCPATQAKYLNKVDYHVWVVVSEIYKIFEILWSFVKTVVVLVVNGLYSFLKEIDWSDEE